MKLKFNILLSLLACTFFCSSGRSQIRKIDSLYDALSIETQEAEKAKTLLRISNTYIRAGYIDSADRYARMALKLGYQTKQYRVVANVAKNLSATLYQAGHSDSSLFFLSKAKDLFYLIGDTDQVAGVLNNMGIISRISGDYLKTLDYYFQSLSIAERYKDTAAMAMSYNNIAETYIVLKDTSNALQYGLKSVSIQEAFSNKQGICAAYFFLSEIYVDKGKIDAAIRCNKRALSLAERQGNVEYVAHASCYLGSAYVEKREYALARRYLDRSLQLCRKIGDHMTQSVALSILASLESSQGKHDLAKDYAHKSLKLAEEVNDLTAIANRNELLGEVYSAAGNFAKALHYHRISDNYKDSLFQASVMREAAVKGANYENEKRQYVIRKEQEKKDVLAREEKYRKNVILTSVVVTLLLALVFSYNLKKRFNITNRQKNIIEHQQAELLASIRYAKRIQEALLVTKEFLEKFVPNNFILHLPKDIVSGDFYWGVQRDQHFYFAVCDCTGHGVPGAFLSLLNIHYLSEAIEEKGISEPGLILDHVREHMVKQFGDSRDGMDAVIIRIPLNRGEEFVLSYAAANGGAVMVRGEELLNFERDKMPVGRGVFTAPFTTHQLHVKSGDCIYLYSDGYADQFGGPNGKKMKHKKMVEAIKLERSENMELQGHLLKTFFMEWRGKLAQVDDVTVVGIRF